MLVVGMLGWMIGWLFSHFYLMHIFYIHFECFRIVHIIYAFSAVLLCFKKKHNKTEMEFSFLFYCLFLFLHLLLEINVTPVSIVLVHSSLISIVELTSHQVKKSILLLEMSPACETC